MNSSGQDLTIEDLKNISNLGFYQECDWSCMLIPKHSLLSSEPRDCSIDIQTEQFVHTGVMFLPELA